MEVKHFYSFTIHQDASKQYKSKQIRYVHKLEKYFIQIK